MEDLERYIEAVIEPTIKEFEAHPTSVRHAFLACVVTFHAADYLAFPKKPRTTRQKLGRESTDFLQVDRWAHAFKHVATGHGSTRLLAKSMIARPPAVWGEMVWGLSRWNDSTGGVTLNDNRDVDVLDTVKRAVVFLREKVRNQRE